MDQQALRELEHRCVQEEPPFCSAACPLRVDVRAVMAALARDDVRAARRVLDRHQPFPDIVARLCEAPCRAACKRGEVDDPLSIGLLERFCVDATSQVLKAPKMPAKGGRIAVVGGGLFAMTAAFDLARKGRGVVLFTAQPQLGGHLDAERRSRLPAGTFQQAADTLEAYGVQLHYGARLDPDALRALMDEYDALCIDANEVDFTQLPWPVSRPDAVTLALNDTGLFGGGTPSGPEFRLIGQVADGRRAALSVERFLQKVSLTAERDREGSIPTRLFTSIKGVQEVPALVPADGAHYSDTEARAEAGRCLLCQCLECVRQCAFLQEFKEYPKTLVRRIYNNLSIVQGTRSANTMINSCSLCGQCTVICPHDFPVATVCREARQQMMQSGHMPPSAHDFALEEMRHALSEACTLARHQPGLQQSRFLFFPGCQLAGSAPAQVEATYRFLMEQLQGGVGLLLSCCGIPARWAGSETLFADSLKRLATTLETLGRPELICACTSCLTLVREHLPDYAATSLWEILATLDTLPPNARTPKQPLTLHDPCGARENAALRAGVRALCTRLGYPVAESALPGELADCCGYGGLMQFANQTLGQRAAAVKAGRSDRAALAYCAMCRDNMAQAGTASAHLLEYLFPDDTSGEPLERPNPGFSRRHENRSRIRERLMHSLWQEETENIPAHSRLRLHLAPDLAKVLDSRHILMEDVQKVIQHAESTGSYLLNPENGHRLACHRPVRVTYWVEYETAVDGFTVHNGYSHRMELPEKRA